jgi:deoxyribodipyrimidine photolyase-related protein
MYIEHKDYHQFRDQLKNESDIYMYYPNDLTLKKSYDNVKYIYNLPNFLLSVEDDIYKQNIYRHKAFYDRMKHKLQILTNVENQDKYNRLKPDKKHKYNERPSYHNKHIKESVEYVLDNFKHYGITDINILVKSLQNFPTSYSDSQKQLKHFIEKQLDNFQYQDFIDKNEVFVHHSNLSCVLNNGLLTPKEVIDALKPYETSTKINNYEGFLRQIIGWREYMRYVYHKECNEFNIPKSVRFNKSLSDSIWKDNEVIETEYNKLITNGYSHHIVRLMIFLNWFILNDIRAKDIIEWFSITHIDAYPWVMYSNILAMGYFNKKFMTKQYISSSNYILKMSNYKKGDWCKKWDKLYHLKV